MVKWLLTLPACLVCTPLAPVLAAAPEPELGQKSWQLDISFHDPERIEVLLPGDSAPTVYWYVLFTVTNNTGKEVPFYPSFRLVTENLQVLEGGAGVHPRAYDHVIARHAKLYPFICEPYRITGTLLQGKENERTSAVVFPEFDPVADAFTIYISGLSGEIARVRNPGFDPDRPEEGDNLRYFLVRRTLAVDYSLPGDPQTRKEVLPIRRSRRWVMW